MPSPYDGFHSNELVERRGGSAGTYLLSQATIRLGPGMEDLFGPGQALRLREDPEAAAIFLHEYMHYFHNVSTLVGCEQTAFTGTLLSLYAKTLDPSHDGTSLGGAALDTHHRKVFELARDGFKHFARPWNDGSGYALATRCRVASWKAVPGPSTNLKRAELELDVYFGSEVIRRKLVLDTQVLEEGIAFTAESLFRADARAPAAADVPFFPYKLLEGIVHTFAPSARPIDIWRLGVLALNQTSSGVWLMQQLSIPVIDAVLVRSSELPRALNWTALFPGAKAHCFTKLNWLSTHYDGRGSLDRGVQSLVATSKKVLDRRLASPFLDIPAVGDVVDWPRVFTLMSEFSPCEVLLERFEDSEQIGRDSLYTFGSDSDENVEGRRAFHLAVDSMLAHLSVGTWEFQPSAGRARKCPVYAMCRHAIRRETPLVCANNPWSTAAAPAGQRCWYGNGVLGLMARYSVKRSNQPVTDGADANADPSTSTERPQASMQPRRTPDDVGRKRKEKRKRERAARRPNRR